MIKNDELVKLRERAERSGEAGDLWEYVERLEERLDSPHSALLHDPADTERTMQTAAAHEEGRDAIDERAMLSGPVQIVVTPNATYALELRGQASATAHGCQGFRSTRGELLYALQSAGLPVYIAFKDGGVWQTAWMEELPPAKSLRKSSDRDDARAGWYVGEKPEHGEPLFERRDRLELPRLHEPAPAPQAGLV